jgi:hypothetical protein
MYQNLTNAMRYDTLFNMATTEQKKKLLKAKIAVALHDALGRVPKTEDIDQVFLLARVMYKAVLGLHYTAAAEKERSAGYFLVLLLSSQDT